MVFEFWRLTPIPHNNFFVGLALQIVRARQPTGIQVSEVQNKHSSVTLGTNEAPRQGSGGRRSGGWLFRRLAVDREVNN